MRIFHCDPDGRLLTFRWVRILRRGQLRFVSASRRQTDSLLDSFAVKDKNPEARISGQAFGITSQNELSVPRRVSSVGATRILEAVRASLRVRRNPHPCL
jgi:hypothetical protein